MVLSVVSHIACYKSLSLDDAAPAALGNFEFASGSIEDFDLT